MESRSFALPSNTESKLCRLTSVTCCLAISPRSHSQIQTAGLYPLELQVLKLPSDTDNVGLTGGRDVVISCACQHPQCHTRADSLGVLFSTKLVEKWQYCASTAKQHYWLEGVIQVAAAFSEGQAGVFLSALSCTLPRIK